MRFFLFFIFLFLGLVRFSLFPAPKDKLSFRWRHVQPATHLYFYWDLIAIKRPLFCERIVSDAGDLIITKFYCLNVRAQKTCSCTLTPELPVLLLYIELHWYTSLINGAHKKIGDLEATFSAPTLMFLWVLTQNRILEKKKKKTH